MRLNIIYTNNDNCDISFLKGVKDYYLTKDIDVYFHPEIENIKYQIKLEIKKGKYNGGSAGMLGFTKYDTDGLYPITYTLGKRYNNGLDYGDPTIGVIHEIMHIIFFQMGLGDIHNYNDTSFNNGNTYEQNNNAFQYLIDSGKLPLLKDWLKEDFYAIIKDEMNITEQQLKKLYLLIFHRKLDDKANGYINKSLDFILSEFLKSPEWKIYNKLHQAAKEIEHLRI